MKEVIFALALFIVFTVISFADNNDGYTHYRETHRHYYKHPSLNYSWDYNYYYAYRYGLRKAQAIFNEIGLLEKKKLDSQDAKRQVFKLKILYSNFYKLFTTDTLPIPIAELKIENKSEYSITKIYFKGKLTTHITKEVLNEGNFDYELTALLKPGQTCNYDIHLDSFTGWAKINLPDITIFDVTVCGFETEDGRSFMYSFSDNDQKKLDKLKERYIY